MSGATFELLYQAPGPSSYVRVASGLQTGSAYAGNASGTWFDSTESADDGCLAISGLKKGCYQLDEVSNRGYSVDGESKPTASWTVSNADKGTTISLAADGQPMVSWDGAVPTGGTLANQPLHADVLLTKADSRTYAALDGVGFTLQRKAGEVFEDVSCAGALLTGRAYALAVDSDGSITGAAEVADQAVSGQLKVSTSRGAPIASWRQARFPATPPPRSAARRWPVSSRWTARALPSPPPA